MKKRQKQSASLFSNLDYRILLLFLLLILTGLIVFWLRARNRLDCGEAAFRIRSEHFAAGEVIEFISESEKAKEWEWDFGDGSAPDRRKSTLHQYAAPGTYRVRLTLNSSCQKEQLIEITDRGRIIDRTKLPYIVAPEKVEAGEPVIFKYNYYTDQTVSWQWSFGESGRVDATEEYPEYRFQTPGKKVVTLIVNGEMDYKAYRELYVVPRTPYREAEDTLKAYIYEKPVERFHQPIGNPPRSRIPELLAPLPLKQPPDNPEAITDIATERFKNLLYQVINQTKEKNALSEYCCGEPEIPVIKNGKEIIRLSAFLDEVIGKNIKIESLRLTKNSLNCVAGFSISYKVKNLMAGVKDNNIK